MTRFRFPLQRVLEWRRTQLELAESRFKQQTSILAGLDRKRAEMEAAGHRAECQVREWQPVSGADLAALDGFRTGTQARQRALAAEHAECERELLERQRIMLEARRQLRLLERLRERREAEWRAECNREMEQLAAEAFLARWPASPGVSKTGDSGPIDPKPPAASSPRIAPPESAPEAGR